MLRLSSFKAFLVERLAKKLNKQELNIKFFVTYGDEYFYPKLTQWKNIKSNHVKQKNRFYRKIQLDEINSKHRLINEIRQQYTLPII